MSEMPTFKKVAEFIWSDFSQQVSDSILSDSSSPFSFSVVKTESSICISVSRSDERFDNSFTFAVVKKEGYIEIKFDGFGVAYYRDTLFPKLNSQFSSVAIRQGGIIEIQKCSE